MGINKANKYLYELNKINEYTEHNVSVSMDQVELIEELKQDMLEFGKDTKVIITKNEIEGISHYDNYLIPRENESGELELTMYEALQLFELQNEFSLEDTFMMFSG